MQLAQISSPCHTGWLDPIPICAIPVGQCIWPKSVLCAIQVGRIQYPSVPYRSANAVCPNHFSVPYRLAGSDTYPCHTGRPMQLNNSSVPYWSANAVGPNHFSMPYRSANAVHPNHLSVPYRVAGSDTYPCHTRCTRYTPRHSSAWIDFTQHLM